jgi:phosphatidylglycerophosphatase C
MNKNRPKTIAAFDFDGTLTTKDTLFDFAIFCIGWPKFLIAILLFLPTAVSYKIGKITNSEAKEVLFGLFFRNMDIEYFQKKGEKYAGRINSILNNEALEKLNWHKKEGHLLIIVSASIENWIAPWASQMGFEKVIATKAEVVKRKLTGRFSSANCNGPEKPIRLLAEYPQRAEYQLHAYGDTDGDKELLEEADFPFYQKFN